MFGKSKDVKKYEETIEQLKSRVDSLELQKKDLNEDVERLKLKKKIEDEDIKHMVKIKEEKLELEHQKRMVALEQEKQQEIHQIQNEYRDKIEKNLEGQLVKMDNMYKELLGRLPDVNVRLKGEV